MKKLLYASLILVLFCFLGIAYSANVVPPVMDLPGTQPNEVGTFDNPGRCDNCHGDYDVSTYTTSPAFGWKGSAMGNAGRDPIFWATLAIAEQDFDGAGDLCIRCHSAGGWIAGRSTPTDGSGLNQNDDDGIDCDTCHLSTNPDNSDPLLQGVMFDPFVANSPITGEGFYGSGILSLWGVNDKLGPYNDAVARHRMIQSAWHRSEDFCGTCHDVSNSVVGHYAPNHGAQPGAVGNVITNGPRQNPRFDPILQQSNVSYVGLNNPPYAYGIVERTYSEYKSSAFSGMPISNFENLPADLRVTGGALQLATLAGEVYDDSTPRNFTCQSCHMRATTGVGCDKSDVPIRNDLPRHDLTGGNNWVYPLIQYQDEQGTLRMGGGLDAVQLTAMDAGISRAEDSLRSTINMQVIVDTLKLTNLTGHKAITGYPEGRRMWLNIVWKDAAGNTIREDGKYGPLTGTSFTYTAADGTVVTFTPESLEDLKYPYIYEAHYGMTQDWANILLTVDAATAGTPGATNYGSIVLDYDRITGADGPTIADLAAGNVPHVTDHETFHFALNNAVLKDNRIPPYGMSYDEAQKRNALPVPETQHGNPGAGGTYNHFDEIDLAALAPRDADGNIIAAGADITLYYQGTSWEYVQFLWKANNGQNAFLGQEGVNFLDAWVRAKDKNNESMVKPFAMATATWGTTPPPACTPAPEGPFDDPTCADTVDNDCDGLTDAADPDCTPSCSEFTTRDTCRNQPGCKWNNRSGTCIVQ